MTRRVVVLGGAGMLGQALTPTLAECGWDVAAYDIQDADITRPGEIRALLEAARPEAVVHAAAMTDVDGCEREPDRAYRVNALGTGNVAAACHDLGAALLYVSTDFVFDGLKREPYVEDDPIAPLGAYGRTKAWGEQFVRERVEHHWVVRTQWLFGPGGGNFVDTMRRLFAERDEVSVVADQTGSPTATGDLAAAIARILGGAEYGTYHASCAGETTWFGFAEAIAERVGYQGALVPLTTAQWNAPARRPAYSVLANRHLEQTVGDPCRAWEAALEAHLAATGER